MCGHTLGRRCLTNEGLWPNDTQLIVITLTRPGLVNPQRSRFSWALPCHRKNAVPDTYKWAGCRSNSLEVLLLVARLM